jgi:hypothetical protein
MKAAEGGPALLGSIQGVFFYNADRGISTWSDPRVQDDIISQKLVLTMVTFMPVALFAFAMVGTQCCKKKT